MNAGTPASSVHLHRSTTYRALLHLVQPLALGEFPALYEQTLQLPADLHVQLPLVTLFFPFRHTKGAAHLR